MNKKSSYVGGEKFNKLSKKEGYRSRSAYKLKQINESHNLIKPNQNILDIVKSINIGVDSLVFIDDNPAERDIVFSH